MTDTPTGPYTPPAEVPADPNVPAPADPAPLPPLPPPSSNLPVADPNLPTDEIVQEAEQLLGIKSGTATTEFWMSLGVLLVNTGAAVGMLLGHRIDADTALRWIGTGNGGVAVAYAGFRAWLKGKVVSSPTPSRDV